jgi:serine/threonine-protein kinase HipA
VLPDSTAIRLRVAERVHASNQPEADQATFLKAVIAFWLLGATDGHAKNFGVLSFARRPLSHDPALRCNLGAAKPRCEADQAHQNEAGDAVGDSRH